MFRLSETENRSQKFKLDQLLSKFYNCMVLFGHFYNFFNKLLHRNADINKN